MLPVRKLMPRGYNTMHEHCPISAPPPRGGADSELFVCQPVYQYAPVKSSPFYISSPLKSSWKIALTNCFLLIFPIAFRGMWSTTLSTCGIL